MCRVDSQIFLMAASFFYSNNCLQKTGGFAINWPLPRAKFASVWLVGSKGRGCKLLKNRVMMQRRPFTHLLSASLLSCNWVAASRTQIVPVYRQLHANFPQCYSCCLRLAATRVQFACDWWPLGYKLYATGRQSHANFACASSQYSAKPPVFLQAHCENNYLNLKMKTLFKNIRIFAAHVLAKAYPLTICMARSNLVRLFL